MKLNFYAIAVFAVCSLVSCSGKKGETVLTGMLPADYEGTVTVSVADKDTVISAENGSFSIALPVNLTSVSYVRTDLGRAMFISDGSKISVNFTEDTPLAVSSDKGGACQALSDYEQSTMDFVRTYRERISEIQADASIPQDKKDSVVEASYNEELGKYLEKTKKVINSNLDNYVSVAALTDIYNYLSPDELTSVISSLAPELQNKNSIVSLKNAVQAKANTAEGKKFTDFEVETTPGHVEKFSDYVGNGKYMLVDFWASWCGPCKAEIPNLKNVYAKYHGDKFDVLSVAVWDQPQASLDTAAAYGLPWNHMINTQRIATDIYGIQGIPHIILVGPDGTILKRDLRGGDIEKAVSEYVR